MNAVELAIRIPHASFAFRGYNQTNLGRTAELLAHRAYGDVVRRWLREASLLVRDVSGRPCDLVARVEAGQETSLPDYADALALILAAELAQLELLRKFHGIDFGRCRYLFGYSFGEIGAMAAAGVWDLRAALKIPVALAPDCIALAEGATLGVIFSRAKELCLPELERAIIDVNLEGNGVVGLSTLLSPNSVILAGQGTTLDRVLDKLHAINNATVHLRKNEGAWPPMHTPIVWQRNLPNRAGEMLHTLPGGCTEPHPPILSLVTGEMSYTALNARDMICCWMDRPQRLWDAVCRTMTSGIETVVHVGPAPNLIPATFRRLRTDVESQLMNSMGLRALSAAVSHPWLRALLPNQTALLRAPDVEHVILEDWLLETPLP